MTIKVLRFADREFYRDWWNSNNVLEFWKTWNLPVHRWAVRHLFKVRKEDSDNLVDSIRHCERFED